MYIATVDGIALHQMLQSGYRNLKKNVNTINDLNVFPVPDGDTGTNLLHTLGGGLNVMPQDEPHAGVYMQKLAKAVLLSARGNSGVIFSQFVYGLARGFAEKDTVDFSDFAYAFHCAQEAAYKAIMTPTEGTILTVIREAADYLENATAADMEAGFAGLLRQMKSSLSRTPELLPVLKEAGVVDSGGAGLVCFMEGLYAHLRGEAIEDTPGFTATAAAAAVDFGPDSRLEYGYCTEFILQLMNYKTDLAVFDPDAFVKPLEQLGNSIVSVHQDGIVKVHIHTFTPEKVLEYGRRFGEFLSVKIENMSVQHSQTQSAAPMKETVKYAIVTVASGAGLAEYFKSIGANAVIDGGQTSNPSVDAFLDAFRRFDAEHIVVLPNNSNIVLTAQQAARLYTDCPVHVIPTKSIVEGYSAMSMMNLWCDTVDELLEDMTAGLSGVTTAYVTTAVRDSHLDGLAVKQGQYIGLEDKHLLVTGDDKVATATALVQAITASADQEVIIVFRGKDATEEEAAALRRFLENEYPLADIGFVDGGQEVYDFIISLEKGMEL